MVRSLPTKIRKGWLVTYLFATHAICDYGVTDVDCWAQNGHTHGRVFATFKRQYLANMTSRNRLKYFRCDFFFYFFISFFLFLFGISLFFFFSFFLSTGSVILLPRKALITLDSKHVILISASLVSEYTVDTVRNE